MPFQLLIDYIIIKHIFNVIQRMQELVSITHAIILF